MLILIIAGLFVFVSCSSPLDKPYKKETLQEDMMLIKKKVSEEDFALLTGQIMLKTMSEDEMLGMTYGDLLEEGKKIQEELLKEEEEEKRLAEEARKEEEERVKRLEKTLSVNLVDKGYTEVNYSDYITMKFTFNNKSSKNIRAFSGKVVIYDLFDEEITSVGIAYDDPVPAKSKVNWDAQTDYNQFLDSDKKFKNKDLEDLKIKWVPEKIIFEDGTTSK